jgi:hypothetical protein
LRGADVGVARSTRQSRRHFGAAAAELRAVNRRDGEADQRDRRGDDENRELIGREREIVREPVPTLGGMPAAGR